MNDTFMPFDWHRIFLGDAPLLFLLEIVLRTLIMYSYTVFFVAFAGQTGNGSIVNAGICYYYFICSAVGDPMVGADIPILHGAIAITVVTIFQILWSILSIKIEKLKL
jgi:uncharacterized membrane protein YcaP (DUF421 family)